MNPEDFYPEDTETKMYFNGNVKHSFYDIRDAVSDKWPDVKFPEEIALSIEYIFNNDMEYDAYTVIEKRSD